MNDWLTSTEIAAAKLPDLPHSRRGVENHNDAHGWRAVADKARLRQGKTKPAMEYHISLLPEAARERLSMIAIAETADDAETRAGAEKRCLDSV